MMYQNVEGQGEKEMLNYRKSHVADLLSQCYWNIYLFNNSHRMSTSYRLKELYESKYFESRTPKNSIERVQLIQKRMKQINSHKVNSSASICNSSAFNSCLEDFYDDSPKRINRFAHGKSKTMDFRAVKKQCNQNSQESLNQRNQSSIARNFSLNSQKKKLRISSALRFRHSMKKQKKHEIKQEKELFKRKNTKLNAGVVTPSRKVVIGGCNLEEEAEVYRQQFLKMEDDLEKYRAQQKNESLHFSIISQKRSTKSQKRCREKMQNKTQRRNPKQKEQTELLPWSVFVDHQFY